MNFRSLGRYEIRGEIGRGNMGIVYRAHDPVIDRLVALKTVLVPESTTDEERETFLKRFFQEARTAGKLIHPNIVVTYDAATDEVTGTPFIAMELIDGEPLSKRLEKEGRIPWEQPAGWVISLARALHQAHQEGIVHRDIKPANIMITSQGVPKITDFGIAKLPTAHLTGTGVVIGTPYFMSPEQLRGEPLDGRSDLFSLGALLYNLVAGQRPFEGTELAAIASQVLYRNPPPVSELLSDVPRSLDGVIARALAKTPGERYASGEELADDLVAVQQGATPRRALSLGERTRPSRTPALVADAERRDRDEGLEPETARPQSSAALETFQAPGSPRAVARFKGLWSSPRRRSVAVALGLVLVLLSTLFFFREEIAQRKLFFEATRAAKNGQLELGERKLEELLDRNPDLENATELLLEVSSSLVLHQLPIEIAAKHHHRLGSCTGQLTLRIDVLEYSSKSHGRWHWPFERLRAVEAEGPWKLSLQTYEDDMLGLVTGKNYNFSLLGDSPNEEFWKRYERLYRRSRAGGPSSSIP